MELNLHIYKGREIIKTYKTETVDLMYGTVEDILNVLELDKIKTGENLEIASCIVKASGQLKPFLKDLFDGVTDEEIRNTRMQNLIEIFKGLYQYAIMEMNTVSQKN